MDAPEAKGQTAYITALDLPSGKMLWRSALLVENGETLAVVQGELFVDMALRPRSASCSCSIATEAKRQTLQTSTSPEIIVLKGEAFYVRGYNSDFVFDVD